MQRNSKEKGTNSKRIHVSLSERTESSFHRRIVQLPVLSPSPVSVAIRGAKVNERTSQRSQDPVRGNCGRVSPGTMYRPSNRAPLPMLLIHFPQSLTIAREISLKSRKQKTKNEPASDHSPPTNNPNSARLVLNWLDQ